MINSKMQACSVLGIRLSADEGEIKSAYKSLVKLYHPDAGKYSDTAKYNEVIEAYEYLTKNDTVVASRVMGAPRQEGSTVRQTSSAKDYASFEKKMKKQKAQKAAEFDQKAKEYSEKIKKQDEEYKRAMAAIDSIRVARALEAMVWANGLNKEDKTNEQD